MPEGAGRPGRPARCVLTKCCLLERGIEVDGATAVVPWGANLDEVRAALRALCGLPATVPAAPAGVPDMSAHPADSAVYGHLWTTPEASALFSDEGRTQAWLRILAALAAGPGRRSAWSRAAAADAIARPRRRVPAGPRPGRRADPGAPGTPRSA